MTSCFDQLRCSFYVIPFLILFHGNLIAQDGERSIQGRTSTENLRAPFGDDFEVFNFGKGLNTEFSEYNPVLTPDHEYMLYITRHDSATGGKVYPEDGQYYEDMHLAHKTEGGYTPVNETDHPLYDFVKRFNSKQHDAPVYIMEESQTVVVFKENDLWYSELVDGVYQQPIRFEEKINFKYYHRHASITKDGRTMVFTSEVLDKELNRFHLDLFRSVKDEDGKWSKPERLPLYINSPYHEDSPEISPDGKLLFFSSDRTGGLGGYDIYYVELFKQDSVVYRLKEPINSPAQDIYFKMLQDSSTAFFSSNRLGGSGNMDIYEVKFDRFNRNECSVDSRFNLSIFGPDTVVQGGTIVLRARGNGPNGQSLRTTQWYSNGSKVSDRVDMEVQAPEAGEFEYRFYGSSLNRDRKEFMQTCISKMVRVMSPADLHFVAPGARYLNQIPPPSSLSELMNILPTPSGEFEVVNRMATTLRDNPVSIAVLEPENKEKVERRLTIDKVSMAEHGTVVIRDDAHVIYYPAAKFVGLDAFRVTIRNPYGKKVHAWVGVEVLDQAYSADAGRLRDDHIKTLMQKPVSINVLANDSMFLEDIEHISTTKPKFGDIDVAFIKNGMVEYKPQPGFKGTDAFGYEVQFKNGNAERANVYVQVGEIKAATRTMMDYATTNQGNMVSINVFTNDALVPEEKPVLSSISGIKNGAAQMYDKQDGIIVYIPRGNFAGIEEFNYTIELSNGLKVSEMVRVYVKEEAPVLAVVDEAEETEDEVYTASQEATRQDIKPVDPTKVDVTSKPSLELASIYFDFDKVYIRSDARKVMDDNIKLLKEHPKAVIQIVSHCDSWGDAEYNMLLSVRRSKSTMEYLVNAGIDKNRIVATMGKGESELYNDCGDGVPCTKAQHQANRRSDFEIVGSLK